MACYGMGLILTLKKEISVFDDVVEKCIAGVVCQYSHLFTYRL